LPDGFADGTTVADDDGKDVGTADGLDVVVG
jgi:hypothetical protein